MNAIKAEALDVYCLLDEDRFIVTLMLEGRTVSTFEYGLVELAKEYIESMATPEGIQGEDADNAYALIEALEEAADMINDAIDD